MPTEVSAEALLGSMLGFDMRSEVVKLNSLLTVWPVAREKDTGGCGHDSTVG
jgi:hypothetical protein